MVYGPSFLNKSDKQVVGCAVAVYAFEAKSIQQYILSSSKMRDLVSGSELLEALCRRSVEDSYLFSLKDNGVLDCWGGFRNDPQGDNLLDHVLDALGISGATVKFSRRAGGAFVAYLSRDEDAEALRDLWRLAVGQAAPGLPFRDGIGVSGDGDEAAQLARALESGVRHRVSLPEAGPLAARSPRTGLPATGRMKGRGLVDAGIEARATFEKRRAQSGSGDPLIKRLGLADDLAWARELSDEDDTRGANHAMPFVEDEFKRIAVVHADGNGLGVLLGSLRQYTTAHPEQTREVFGAFSEVIQRTSEHAMREAVRRTLESEAREVAGGQRLLPARPLVLGGDDLTIIVRADLAMAFVKVVLEEFEHRSRELLETFGEKFDLPKMPKTITACAGVALISSKYPFSMAHDLAESLTRYAKGVSKSRNDVCPPSSVAFHRVTTSLAAEYDELRLGELTGARLEGDESSIMLSLCPYGVGDVNDGLPEDQRLPLLDDVMHLAKLMAGRGVPRSGFRETIDLLHTDATVAHQRWERMREVLRGRDPGAAEDFDRAVGALNGKRGALLNAQNATALLDAYALSTVVSGQPEAREAIETGGDEKA